MADDHEGQQFVATPNDFRDLARGVGVALNDAIHKGRVRVIEHRGFNTVKIEREEDTSDTAMKDLIHVMEEYKCKVFPKIHPGMSISWHAWIHIVTKSASIDRSIFGSDEDDTSLLPLFPGEAGEGEEQNKEIGQPLSLKTNFHILKGDVLLFYKSVEIS